MRVLVDTGIWSLALRRGGDASSAQVGELRSLVGDGRVVMIGPIRQELLSGIRSEVQFKELEARLRAFPDLPLETEDYVTAARFSNRCRGKGVQGSHTDFLICAAAARRRLAVFTADNDFTLYARHIPLALHS